MVVTPLAHRRGRVRRALVPAVVGGLAAASTLSAAQRWDPRRAALAAAAVLSSTALVEAAGTRTGVPFGRYSYTGALRPHVGGVPVVVPAAWLAMALPSREAAHAALGATSTPLRRVLLGAAALTAWDLFLDPQMVGEGYWRWDAAGRYRGIPVTNFLGWFLAGSAVRGVLEAVLPIGRDDEADAALVAQYGFVAAMETVGFAAFFRDRLVALAGGTAMLPIAGAAAARLFGRRVRG
jgi:putative membrane protein